MKLKGNAITLQGPKGAVILKRNEHGIPEITAREPVDAAFALGWVHADDRQMQAIFTRILIQGRTAELLQGSAELVEVDRYMRRMGFYAGIEKEIAKLNPSAKAQMQAYADGFNQYISENGTVFELKLISYQHEPWQIADSIVLGKIMGFFGQTDAQAALEKLIVQMIQEGIDEKKLRELFPYLKDRIDVDLLKKVKLSPPVIPEAVEWLRKLPRMTASNNWVISGSRTHSGKPYMCNDPHLDVKRLPAVWCETLIRYPDNKLSGVSVPGIPGTVIGRSRHVAWGTTFAYMDMIDYRIEKCREGKYLRGTKWIPFKVREEVIKVKKKEPVVERIYENELGVLEGDPAAEGYYLVVKWAAGSDCGAELFNAALEMHNAKTCKDLMALFRSIDSIPISWVVADTKGNIGYQMSGRQFNRPASVSGLLPHPAWEKKFDYRGFVSKEKLPAAYNPKEGFLVTANNDLNHLGKSKPINLCMGSYRADRIADLLKSRKKVNVELMKRIQYDGYSLQAEALMKIIKPLLPDTPNARILKEWDCVYSTGSVGATLFESVYLSLLRVVFGDNGMGRQAIDYLLTETAVFAEYYANFDTILFKTKSAWFGNEKREDLFRKAIREGLDTKAVPYERNRRFKMTHLLFDGKLPRFLGFDYRPMPLPGSRATIIQGQIFRAAGRMMTFAPSYRIIADMATDEIHTNLPGGPSDRRFSRWYACDVENWRKGIYKVLK